MQDLGRLRVLICLGTIAGTPACLRTTEFHCTTDSDCSGGFCEATKYCSFTDSACAQGRRYGDFGGALSNKCVGENGGDGGVDSPMRDGGGDGGGGCPSGYATINGGGTHMYKRLASAQWVTQRDACAADGANVYLAIPNDMAELQGIATLGASALTWVGIDDMTAEGTFETVLGAAATYLPWNTAGNEPNNQGEQDCVAAITSNGLLETDRCGDVDVAVCECEP